jgi:hypothetical protein
MVSLNVFVFVVTVLVLVLAGAIILILRLRKVIERTCAFGCELALDLFESNVCAGVPDWEWRSREILVNWRTDLLSLLKELNPIDRALDPADWIWRIKFWWRAKIEAIGLRCGLQDDFRITIVDDKQGDTDD